MGAKAYQMAVVQHQDLISVLQAGGALADDEDGQIARQSGQSLSLIHILMGFTQLFSGVLTILGTLLFMLQQNVPITLVVVCITPLTLYHLVDKGSLLAAHSALALEILVAALCEKAGHHKAQRLSLIHI